MANQPTKYSKFLVGAASAALVASAVAPVVSAADFTDSKDFGDHATAIQALVDLGVVKGYTDGSFKPNQELTRNNVVKFLGKWLVSEGYEIPADAVSNPRFTDLKSTSEKETLEYAAVVKDNGVFVGSNGKLMGANKMTREDMAVVIVRALNTVYNMDLETYVAAQDFKRDVKDLNTAYASKKDAIDVLDFFDITNPSVANFNPKNTTTRGQFASFLNRSITTDFSKVTGVGNAAVSSIKAVNSTTVEVTFKEAVETVGTFTIEGLEITNAAVKQTDAKTVVLTTKTALEGGKKYEVKLNSLLLGSFEGLSTVIPTKIDVTTYSVQQKVGATVTLSAFIGVKEAGVPVTFNVDAPVDSLNKDQVAEALTDANGVATYTYTQYAPGVDNVAVYPTGAPAVRDFAKVFWGKELILTVDTDAKTVDNGANRTYKVAYKDPATGLPVAGKVLNVTFEENLNDIDLSSTNDTDASVRKENGQYVTPHQASAATAGSNREDAFQITTNSQGEASFTVTGKNTKATPVVFEDTNKNSRYEKTELQAKAGVSDFKGVQSPYTITFDKKEDFVAALSSEYNGQQNPVAYKLTINKDLKDKDGKAIPYAGATVKVAIQQNQDNTLSNNTSAQIASSENGSYNSSQVVSVVTDSKGEATFYLKSAVDNSKATPVAWIDLNAAGNVGQAGNNKLEEGEPFGVAATVTFLKSVVVAPAFALNAPTAGPFVNGDTMTWTASLRNQSNKVSETAGIKNATYTITNTSNSIQTFNPRIADLSGASYNNLTITYAGATQTTQHTNGSAITLEPGTTVTIHGTAPAYRADVTTAYNITTGEYSSTQDARLSIVAPGTGSLSVSSQVQTVRQNTTITDTRNNNNTYDYAAKSADYVTSTLATGTVTGEVIGFEVEDNKFGATNYGRVVVKERHTGVTKHYYYNATTGFSAALDATLSNASTDNTLAGATPFENLVTVGDEVQTSSAANTVRLFNKDASTSTTQAKGNGVVNPGLIGTQTIAGVKAQDAKAAEYQSAVVATATFSSGSFTVGTGTTTTDSVSISVQGTDTAAVIVQKINAAFGTTIAAEAKEVAGRVFITAKTTSDSIIVSASNVPTLFNIENVAPTALVPARSAQYDYTFTSDITVGQTVTVNGVKYLAGNANSGLTFDATGATVAADLANLALTITYHDVALNANAGVTTLTLTEKLGKEGTTTFNAVTLN